MGRGTGTTLTELEFSWFAQRVSGASVDSPARTVEELKRTYFSRGSLPSAVLAGPIDQVETAWLQIISGATVYYLGDLWRQAVAVNTNAV